MMTTTKEKFSIGRRKGENEKRKEQRKRTIRLPTMEIDSFSHQFPKSKAYILTKLG
jgi:hypothetical protein